MLVLLRPSSEARSYSFQARSFSSSRVVWIYPLLRASTEHILIVRGLRARGMDTRVPLLRLHHFQSCIEFMPAGRTADAIRFDRKFV